MSGARAMSIYVTEAEAVPARDRARSSADPATRSSSAATSARTRLSASSALWPTPTSSMFSAQRRRPLVCGATIESCHDQIETMRTTGGASSDRLSSASHSLPGTQLRETRAGEQPRVDAAVMRGAERCHRRDLCDAVTPHVRAGDEPHPCCGRRSRRAGRRSARESRRSSSPLARRRARSTQAADHTRSCREVPARAQRDPCGIRTRRRRCIARRGSAGRAPEPAPEPGQGPASDRAPSAESGRSREPRSRKAARSL